MQLKYELGRIRDRSCFTHRAPYQYQIRRLIVRSREVSKPRDLYSKLPNRSVIWQAHRQQCCRGACQISKRCDNINYQSLGFETSRDLTIMRLIRYWNGAQASLMQINCPWPHRAVATDQTQWIHPRPTTDCRHKGWVIKDFFRFKRYA